MREITHIHPEISVATEADLPAISALADVIWRAHYPGIISHEQIEYMLERMYNLETLRDDLLLRCVRFDRLLVGPDMIGFAASGPEAPAVIKLHKLYLHPDFQGRGFGSLLLRHCASEASKAGARRLILAVNKNNAKALAAYLRNGFTIMDSIVVSIGGGFVMDDYLLGKDLDALTHPPD